MKVFVFACGDERGISVRVISTLEKALEYKRQLDKGNFYSAFVEMEVDGEEADF